MFTLSDNPSKTAITRKAKVTFGFPFSLYSWRITSPQLLVGTITKHHFAAHMILNPVTCNSSNMGMSDLPDMYKYTDTEQ